MSCPEFHELGMADQERWDPADRVEFVAAVEARIVDFKCRACCVTPTDECICGGWSQADEQAFQRRIKDRKADWQTGAST